MSAMVIGVGNALRGDDAAGLEVARRVAEAAPAGVDVLRCEGEPVSMLTEWDGVERVIVVDATESGAAPGTVRRIDAVAEALPPELRRTSTHLLGVADAIELARTLGRLPAETVVYGIEGGTFDAGAPLSPAAHSAVEQVATRILAELDGSG